MLAFICALPGEPEDRAFMLDLYEQFERLMFSVARTYGREGDFPEEVVQESLVKLIGKVELLRELSQKSLAAYVAATTRPPMQKMTDRNHLEYFHITEYQNPVLSHGLFEEMSTSLPLDMQSSFHPALDLIHLKSLQLHRFFQNLWNKNAILNPLFFLPAYKCQ